VALPLWKSAELMYFILVIDLCRRDYDLDNTTLLKFSLSTLQCTRGTESGAEALDWCSQQRHLVCKLALQRSTIAVK